ncbi:A/G-specific adenine glycosylase [Hydrogenovibrio kuenenii]|uniref:A/G-specific adenine glycosylase n=1 Tax=Hydrogenovibrio kuenenii TaxID=63658 RepID=UPI00046422E6|nr:A/G-specific adenine glycosylase [Hydrogenovibrio kuenenii]
MSLLKKSSNQATSFADDLLHWFDLSGRHDLPWQHPKSAYRVWVSEIMLQQTQVQTVIPYFERFISSFPSVKALAETTQDEVLAHWSGLGYYARGRNLHKAAKIIMSEHDGQFPQAYEDIIALPGIGRSTAAAILSIAFQKKYAILDGNVKRVLGRYDAVEKWPGEKQTEAQLWQRAEDLMQTERVDDYTQAIMDLGATICRRSRPLCEQCPVKTSCQANRLDKVSSYPVSKPKIEKPTRHAVFLLALNNEQQVFLQKRPQKGIWGGLWSLPQFDDDQQLTAILHQQNSQSSPTEMADLEVMPTFKHSFTHYHLMLQPRRLSVGKEWNLTGQWVPLPQALEMGLPAPIRKLIEQTEKNDVKKRTLRKNG